MALSSIFNDLWPPLASSLRFLLIMITDSRANNRVYSQPHPSPQICSPAEPTRRTPVSLDKAPQLLREPLVGAIPRCTALHALVDRYLDIFKLPSPTATQPDAEESPNLQLLTPAATPTSPVTMGEGESRGRQGPSMRVEMSRTGQRQHAWCAPLIHIS